MAAGTKAKAAEVESQAKQREASKADLLSRKRPRTAEVIVVLDDDAVLEHDRAVDALKGAKERWDREKPADANGSVPKHITDLEKQIESWREKVDDATVRLVFRAVGNERYDALITACPPTQEQIREAKSNGEPKPPYDPDVFVPALIQASLVVPEMELDEVQTICREWNRDEIMSMFLTCLDVNTRARRVTALGKGSG